MIHHQTGQSDVDAGAADSGLRVATFAHGRHGRISEEQLAAAERTRLYHVNKLAVYRSSNVPSVAAVQPGLDTNGVRAS